MTASALDLKRTLPGYTAKAGRFDVLTIEPRTYLALDGTGDPNTSARYADAIPALFQVSYALKFAGRAAGRDHVVPPLEGLWWADDPAAFTTRRDKSAWSWTLLVLVPPWLGDDEIAAARGRAAARATASPLVGDVHPVTLDEGLCVQTLHIGPFDAEGPTIAALHDHVPAGHTLTGRHHEVYLGDVRRAAAERLRTVLRQPIAPI